MTTVLYLSLYAAIGGAERALLELVGALDTGRFRPLVVVAQPGPLLHALEARGVDVRVEPCPAPPLHALWRPGLALAVIRAAWRLRRFAQSRGVRVFQCGDLLALLLLLPAVVAGGRVLYQVNYVGGPVRQYLLGVLGRFTADVVVACSQDQRAILARGGDWLRRRTVVVWPGIDPVPFAAGDRQALRHELRLADDTPLIGLVARYDLWKGHEIFLEAAARVHAVRPAVRFVMVGGALNAEQLPHVARYRDAVLARRRELGLEQVVAAVDHRDDVASVLAALDVVACPSIHEPFGMVVLEALAARRAVIASDTGGPAEIVEHGRSGLLFATGSSDALAEGLLDLLADAAKRQALGLGGERRVRTRFSARRYAADMEELYARLA